MTGTVPHVNAFLFRRLAHSGGKTVDIFAYRDAPNRTEDAEYILEKSYREHGTGWFIEIKKPSRHAVWLSNRKGCDWIVWCMFQSEAWLCVHLLVSSSWTGVFSVSERLGSQLMLLHTKYKSLSTKQKLPVAFCQNVWWVNVLKRRK